jgi:hypothetical protein
MHDQQKGISSYFIDLYNVAIIHSYIGSNDRAIFYLNKVI